MQRPVGMNELYIDYMWSELVLEEVQNENLRWADHSYYLGSI